MATLAVAAVPLTGGTAWVAAIGAALFDSYVLYPALLGKGKQNALSPRLLDNPVGSNQPGAPRVWAIGARVRVPTHILYQDQKVRQSTSNQNKNGTSVSLRRVYMDAAVALNDRPTKSLAQLYGNGKLLVFNTRNLFFIQTARLTVSVVSGNLRLTGQALADVDWSTVFAVNDYVKVENLLWSSGSDPNGYYKVVAVAGVSSTSSSITLLPREAKT